MATTIQTILKDMSKEDESRRKKIAESLFRQHFSSEDKKRNFIANFAQELRNSRKAALGQKDFDEITRLEEERQLAFLMIFRFCSFNLYREEIGALLIEGLKYQQKDIKRYCYEYADGIMSRGTDLGWWNSLLNKQYVSKYAWKLLRVHANKVPEYATFILKDRIQFWSHDEATRKKWQELDKEFGEKFDYLQFFK